MFEYINQRMRHYHSGMKNSQRANSTRSVAGEVLVILQENAELLVFSNQQSVKWLE